MAISASVTAVKSIVCIYMYRISFRLMSVNKFIYDSMHVSRENGFGKIFNSLNSKLKTQVFFLNPE